MWVEFVEGLTDDEILSLGFGSVDAAIKYATLLDGGRK